MALTLFMTALMVTTPLIARHGRLLIDQRRYRIALDAVSNQLDRLSALPAEELARAVEQLKVDEWTSARLPCAELHGHVAPADIGQRVTLELSYGAAPNQSVGKNGEAVAKRKTVTLEIWITPRVQPPAAASEEDRS